VQAYFLANVMGKSLNKISHLSPFHFFWDYEVFGLTNKLSEQ